MDIVLLALLITSYLPVLTRPLFTCSADYLTIVNIQCCCPNSASHPRGGFILLDLSVRKKVSGNLTDDE